MGDAFIFLGWFRGLVVARFVLFVLGAFLLSCRGGSSPAGPTASKPPGFGLAAITIEVAPPPTASATPTPSPTSGKTPKATATPTLTPGAAATSTNVPSRVPTGGTGAFNANRPSKKNATNTTQGKTTG